MVRRAGWGLAVVSVGVVGGVVIIVIIIIGATPGRCRWAAAVRAVRAVPVGYGEAVGGPGGGREGLSFALVPFGGRHQGRVGAPGVQVASGGVSPASRDQRLTRP